MECGDLTPLISADLKTGQVTAPQTCPALSGKTLVGNKDAARAIRESPNVFERTKRTEGQITQKT